VALCMEALEGCPVEAMATTAKNKSSFSIRCLNPGFTPGFFFWRAAGLLIHN